MLRKIISREFAVAKDGEVYWFTSYIRAMYFAIDNKTDCVECIEYDNGEKVYWNLMTNERKTV